MFRGVDEEKRIRGIAGEEGDGEDDGAKSEGWGFGARVQRAKETQSTSSHGLADFELLVRGVTEAFKKSAKEARDSRKKKKGGEEEDVEDDEVGATASSSSRETDVTKELFFAGFGKKIAKMAVLNAQEKRIKKATSRWMICCRR